MTASPCRSWAIFQKGAGSPPLQAAFLRLFDEQQLNEGHSFLCLAFTALYLRVALMSVLTVSNIYCVFFIVVYRLERDKD